MSDTVDKSSLFSGRHSVCLPGNPEAEIVALCDLSLSLITVPTTVSASNGDCVGILQYPVTIAGRYGQTSIPYTLRSLTHQAQQEIFSVDSNDLAETTTRLVGIETACRSLFESFEPAVRTVIQWHLRQLFSDPGFIDWYASAYAAEHPALSSAAIEELCETISEASDRPYPAPKLGGILCGLAEEYHARVARTVARLTLEPPVPIDLDGPTDRRTIPDVDLIQRAREFADTVDRLFDTTTGVDAAELREQLIQHSDIAVRVQRDHNSDCHLLAIPQDEADVRREGESPMRPALIGHPSGIAWLLDRTFTDAGFGGAVYARQDGSSSWLANPLIPDSSGPSQSTYRQLLARAIVGDHLLKHLFTRAAERLHGATDTPRSVACPLCQLSADACGNGECGFKDLFSQFDAHQAALVSEIAEEIDALPTSSRSLYQ